MASEASWQTTQAAEGAFSEDRRTGLDDPYLGENRLEESSLDDSWRPSSYRSLDQHTIAGLLQKLVERFEESERLYGEALEELHSRLDHLSETREPPKDANDLSDMDTFDRVQTQVNDLARRLEPAGSTPLENFERLGRALAGGLRGDPADGVPSQESIAPQPSPFAQSILAAKPLSRLAPEPDLAREPEDTAFPPTSASTAAPFGAGEDLDKRLVQMANRLERSIGSAMPASTIQSLDTKLDTIGNRIAEAIDAGSNRATLEHVEGHLADIGKQIGRAELQLGRIEGIEQHLRALIARLDHGDSGNAQIDSAEVQKIAAKAATDAARLAADDAKKTAERLDALQRQITAIGDTSRQSGATVVNTLETLNGSLNRLARQVDNATSTANAASTAKPRSAFVTNGAPKAVTLRAASQAAEAQTPGPSLPDGPAKSNAQFSNGSAGEEDASVQAERAKTGPGTPAPMAQAPQGPQTQTPETRAIKTPAPETQASETLAPATPGLEKHTGKKVAAHSGGRPDTVPDDLVAAARQAAQAAAARAEERAAQRVKSAASTMAAPDDGASTRLRPLLIVCAAILLVISAALLYGRLHSKTGPEPAPGVNGPSAPAPAKQGNGSTPEPEAGPAKPKPPRSTAEIDGPAASRHVSDLALPPGVILSIEPPSSHRAR